jgi:DNA uptake protein ComE-like DNA-binding protein
MKQQSLALAILLTLALVSLPAAAHAAPQSQGDQAKSSIKSASTATKDAAKDVGSATSSGAKAASDKVTGKTDINSAGKDQLMKLEGITDEIAGRIVAGRPYRSKRELLTRHNSPEPPMTGSAIKSSPTPPNPPQENKPCRPQVPHICPSSLADVGLLTLPWPLLLSLAINFRIAREIPTSRPLP